MKSYKMIRTTSVALALLASTLAGSAGLTTSTYSVAPNIWSSTPTLYTTLTPNTDQTVSQGGGTNSAVALTFTTSLSFQLDKFDIVVAGGPSSGILHLYPSPVGGTEADGFVNLSFSTDLLNGGAGLPYHFFGTGSQTIMTFDLTGADQVTLAASTKYAFDFTSDPSAGDYSAYNFFVRRGGAFYTGGGNIYATATRDTAAGQRFDVAGGRRDAPLALYAVPEPSTCALLGMGALLTVTWFRRRAA